MASAISEDAGRRLQIAGLSGPVGRYDGLVLICVGLALIVYAAVRFVCTGKLIDDPEMHSTGSVRGELFLSAAFAADRCRAKHVSGVRLVGVQCSP